MPLFNAFSSIRLFRGYPKILEFSLLSCQLSSPILPLILLWWNFYFSHTYRPLFFHYPKHIINIPSWLHGFFQVVCNLSFTILKSYLCKDWSLFIKPDLSHTIIYSSLLSHTPNISVFSPVTSYAFYLTLAHIFPFVYGLHIKVAYKSQCIDSSVFLLTPYSLLSVIINRGGT